MDLTKDIQSKADEPSARDIVRGKISAQVADTSSLLGTQADILGVLLTAMCADIVALADHAGNDCQRKRLELMQAAAGEHDIVVLARETLAKIESGDVKLPVHIKGLPEVVEEVLDRANKTAVILAGGDNEAPE